MPLESIWVGDDLATLVEDVPAEIIFDKLGIASAKLVYSTKWEGSVDLVAALTVHPDFFWLIRKSATILRMEGGSAYVTVEFEGIDPNSEGDEGASKATYSVRGATSSEPITSHKRFADFAGDTDLPLNGARFVTEPGDNFGKFLGFFPLSGTLLAEVLWDEALTGMDSYLLGGLIYTETRVYSKPNAGAVQKAQMQKLGFIDDPPHWEDWVDVPDGTTWLLIACDIEQIGGGIKVSRQWRSSGEKGWCKPVYEPTP